MTWQQIKANKYFVAATSALGTYLATAAYNWVQSGTPALSLAQLKTTALAALGVIIVALYHLYLPSPPNTPSQASYDNGKKLGLLLLCAAFLGVAAHGQTSNGITFTGSTEAAACRYSNSWGACSFTTESLDAVDWGTNKANSLSIEGYELLNPSANVNAYFGGVKLTPDISSLLSKTNIPAGSFSLFAQGGIGVSPQTNTSKIAWFGGGGANYMITPSLTWNSVDARFGRIGDQSFLELSTGIAYLFNPQNSNNATVRAAYMKRLAARYLKMTAPTR